MSIVIVTQPPGPQRDADQAGKLAGTLISVTLAGMADPNRFRKGKAYVAEHAVTRLEIAPGVLRGTVTGSRAEPYTATISVELAAAPADLGARIERQQVPRLSPQADELITSCTCPDFDDPCKHAVATLLQFARELASRPELLLEWRGATRDVSAPRARVGSRASGERHLRLVTAPTAPSPYGTPEWRAFEGVDLHRPVVGSLTADLPPLHIPSAVIDRFDLGEMVRSAHRLLHTPT